MVSDNQKAALSAPNAGLGKLPSVSRPSSRLARLDLLRFVAATAVVAFHVFSAPVIQGVTERTYFGAFGSMSRFGYLGVELFFLISGFVIVMSAQSRTARGFLMHRALRLYPSFWSAVVLTTIALTIFGSQSDQPSFGQVVANLTMLPGYLGSARLDDVYWTLAVELKFYGIVAAILLLGWGRRVELVCILWVLLLVLAEFNIGGRLIRSIAIFPHGAFFVSGTLIYLRFAKGWTTRIAVLLIVAWGLSLLSAHRGATDFILDPSRSDRAIVLTIVTCCFALVLWATGSKPAPRFGEALGTLGALTYPLYLTHGRIGRLLFSRLADQVGPANAAILELAIVCALSWLIVLTIERRLVPAISRSKQFRQLAGEISISRRAAEGV